MNRYSILLIAALMTAVLCAPALAQSNYQVLITNDIPGGLPTGQPFSPPVVAVHNSGYSMFAPGATASPGIILVAEEGNPSVLAMEAGDSPDVSQTVVGSGPFFDPQIIDVVGNPGDLISMAWMLGRTNDLFTGLYDVELPVSGSLEFVTSVWDAGSEVNTGMIEDLGFYGNPMTGPDENNPIMAVDSYTVYNDPDYGVLTWDFPPSSTVTIIYMGPVANEESTWGEVKALFR
jgi:hypothetical protein